MPESLNDIAPWPRTEAEATAEAVMKALAVSAWARQARIHDMPKVDDTYRAQIGILVNEYGVIRLLKLLGDFHKDVADDAAREVWAEWEAGDGIHEWLWEWLTGWGINPAEVAEVAERQWAEHAEKQQAAAS
jgi:hypothetical protein